MSSKVETYLTEKKNSSPTELSKKFGELEEYYNKKLWHQLTLALHKLVKEPSMQQGTELIKLYKNLIIELENKINPLSLAQIAGDVITQHTDPNEAITFVEKVAPKVVDHQEARVLCNVLIAQITLSRLEDQVRTKKILDETEKMLDEIDGVTPVHGKFYLLASELYCRSGAHSDYYRAALRYLGCTEVDDMETETKNKQAFYLGLAALLGEGIYNFGELLAHPILEALKGSSSEWLLELLFAFNQGNISKFETMKPQWSTQPDLLAKENQLREKIRLLCLMEMTFQRKAWDRQLTFAEIAQETGLPENQVEVMVMRALSLGLVRGTIDQVDNKVNITWVQPRVLDKKQLASMMERLTDWCKDVSSMQNLLQDQASTILTL
ncbi:26S proteasome non-ATPase regulatory subunit 13-like [Homarus americanus]|uniref:26S proteasome non-ATPase regulatory subunit 13 n=1 Tax=Homarus americanus TaxID=6706 RepID=A0A8J5JST5_HOMAM|nr:26S proteasome non-ATPase regulatory subunit 13-like [Homarus americanus]KAG7163682.1 26S proteasome non-ATPase regulatory subunit 13-like [Homarus americanus]